MATREEWLNIREWAKKLLMMGDSKRIDFIKTILDLTDSLREQVILVFFYIYGMRPEELLELKKSDFSIRETELWLRLPPVKEADERMIVLDTTDTPFIDVILKYLSTVPIIDWRIFREFNCPTNFNKILSRLEKRYFEVYGEQITLSPYVFRKFRNTYLLGIGTPKDVLMWRGTKSYKVLEEHYDLFLPVTKFKKAIR